jgi:hypothetical protein
MDFRKLAFFDAGRDSALRCPDAAARRPYLPFREKGSALLVRIPSLWAELVPILRCSHRAMWRDETNSFARLVFLFSQVCEFQQQWDSAPARSRHLDRASWLIAKQIDRSVLPQRAPQPLAFLQASVLPERTSSHATWICVLPVSWILKKAVQKAAVFAWEARIFFRGQRLLPAHAFSR